MAMADPHEGLLGTWLVAGPAGELTLVLEADYSASFNGSPGIWRIDQGALVFGDERGEGHRFGYELTAGELILTAEVLPHPLTLRRLDSVAVSRAELAGRWRAPKGIIELTADGRGTVGGKELRYTADGTLITLHGSDRQQQILYSLEGDTLILGIGAEAIVLKRVHLEEEAADPPSPPGAEDYTLESALAFQESLEATTPEKRLEGTIKGILTWGRKFVESLGTLAEQVDHQRPIEEQWLEARWLYARWIMGEQLTGRADENELRLNEHRSLLESQGEEYRPFVRLAAKAILALPEGHPHRDPVVVAHLLLGHCDWCAEAQQTELEVLALSDLLALGLDNPGLLSEEFVDELIRRGESRLDQLKDDLRWRFRSTAAGHYAGRAIQSRNRGEEESLRHWADKAEEQLGRMQQLDAGEAKARQTLLVAAGVRETAGRLEEAADTYARARGEGAGREGAGAGDGIALLAGRHEGRLRLRLGHHRRAIEVLSPIVPVLENEYLSALEEAEVTEAGSELSEAATNLAFSHAALDEWDPALQTLDRCKSLRFRHRVALREHPDGRRLLEIERALYGVARGAVSIRESSAANPVSGDRTLDVSMHTRLLEDYRKRRPEVRSDLLESPSIEAIAGVLEEYEAVAVLGTSFAGTLIALIAPGDHHAPSGRRVLKEWTSRRLGMLAWEKDTGWMQVLAAPLGYRGVGHREALPRLLAGVDEAIGTALAEMLASSGARRLVIVPHGWLHQVPFWALPSLSELRVVMASSAAGFVRSRRDLPTIGPRALAVADPTLDLPVSEAEAASVERHLSGSGWRVAQLRRHEATESRLQDSVGGVSLLHFCGHGRSDFLSPTRSSLLLHPEPALLAALGGEPFRGLVSRIDRWESHPWDGRYAAVPGRGRLYEILYPEADARELFLEYSASGTLWGRYQGDLLVKLAELWRAGDLLVDNSLEDCRLAFLSACEAGGGGLSPEVDELAGLPAALQLAGVSTVICSLWPISDTLTALYVELFYAELAGTEGRIDLAELTYGVARRLREMSRAEAAEWLMRLRASTSDPRARFRLEAAADGIAGGEERPFAHPADWAAFFVLGAADVVHQPEILGYSASSPGSVDAE